MTVSPFWVTLDGHRPDREVETFLRAIVPYGVLLFARHLESPSQVKELTQCINEAASGHRIRIALDQEGGPVNRLDALGHSFPGASSFAGESARAERTAWEMADAMRELGFDVDFAPVADLGPVRPGTGLEGRVFGETSGEVISCCRAFLRGLARGGIEGCLKHFPGLGGSEVNSHRSLPLIPGTLEEREPHLLPYRELGAELPYVMVAHGSYRCLGGSLPSSLEPAAYRLLAETGFRGLPVTDDLTMGAVAGVDRLPGLVARSLEAGAGIALWVSSQEESLSVLEEVSGSDVYVAMSAKVGQTKGGGAIS